MVDREKVINGLKCCREQDNPAGWRVGGCVDCPYKPLKGNPGCAKKLKDDLLELLTPRVMTLEEVRLLCKDDIVWYEHKGVFRQPRPRVVEFVFDEHITFTDGGVWSFPADGYGERWRLWTSKPNEKARAETPWGTGMVTG